MITFKKISNSLTLSQTIEKQIEEAIRRKELAPGEKLPTENELCKSFRVSRNALREALRSLGSKGLIEIKKGSGMYVNVFSSKNAISSLNLFLELNSDPDHLYHILQLRKMFEPHIAEAASERRTDEDLKKIGRYLQNLIECDSEDLEKEAEIDNRFHLQISKSCGNFAIPLIFEPIFSCTPRIKRAIYSKKPGQREKTVYFHKSIFEAICDRRGGVAREFMREHLLEAERNFLENYKQS